VLTLTLVCKGRPVHLTLLGDLLGASTRQFDLFSGDSDGSEVLDELAFCLVGRVYRLWIDHAAILAPFGYCLSINPSTVAPTWPLLPAISIKGGVSFNLVQVITTSPDY